jgi:uncharacterized protein (DUF3820 family)
MTTQLTCPRCQTSNYTTELKSGNLVATCENGHYIKNLPYSEPALYFGKYKGKKVVEIQDVDYLKWVLKNTHQGKHVRYAIQKQIDSIEFLAK